MDNELSLDELDFAYGGMEGTSETLLVIENHFSKGFTKEEIEKKFISLI